MKTTTEHNMAKPGAAPLRFLCFLLFMSGLLAAAQTNAPSGTDPAPSIDFDSLVYNFGRAKSGETIKHDFVFTNTGNATLEILAVKPGCGCTTAGAWDKRVDPGKTGVIPIQFNSTGYGGPVAKSATVTCNDPARTNNVLQIAGTVWKPIDVTPTMAIFNCSSEAPTNQTKVLRLVSNLEEPITLSDLHCNNPAFNTALKEVKPGKEFELEVTALPPFTNPTVYATITLKTSSTNAPIVTVSAYAMVQQAVTVSPQRVTLPAGPLKAPLRTAVLVRNNSTNAFELSDVRLDLSGVDVSVTQPQTGRLFSINIVFPAGFELQPGQIPELTFKSTHPKFPELKVPVVQSRVRMASPAPRVPAPAATPPVLRTASPVAPLRGLKRN